MDGDKKQTVESSSDCSGGTTSSSNNTFLDMCFTGSSIYSENLSQVDFSAIEPWSESDNLEISAHINGLNISSSNQDLDVVPDTEQFGFFDDSILCLFDDRAFATSSPLAPNDYVMLPHTIKPQDISTPMLESEPDSPLSLNDWAHNCPSKESNTQETPTKRRNI